MAQVRLGKLITLALSAIYLSLQLTIVDFKQKSALEVVMVKLNQFLELRLDRRLSANAWNIKN